MNPIYHTTIATTARPYSMIIPSLGIIMPLTSADAQRLIDMYPVIKAAPHRVTLQGHSSKTWIVPATLGGGAAFLIGKRRVC